MIGIDAIPDGTHVALDTVALIFFLERHETFGEPAARLFERIETGALRASMSTLVLTELLVPLYRAGRARDVSALARRLENFRNLESRSVDPLVATEAARLRARHGLRTPDAIHAASAVLAGAAGIVTHDRAFTALRGELEVWTFDA